MVSGVGSSPSKVIMTPISWTCWRVVLLKGWAAQPKHWHSSPHLQSWQGSAWFWEWFEVKGAMADCVIPSPFITFEYGVADTFGV